MGIPALLFVLFDLFDWFVVLDLVVVCDMSSAISSYIGSFACLERDREEPAAFTDEIRGGAL